MMPSMKGCRHFTLGGTQEFVIPIILAGWIVLVNLLSVKEGNNTWRGFLCRVWIIKDFLLFAFISDSFSLQLSPKS